MERALRATTTEREWAASPDAARATLVATVVVALGVTAIAFWIVSPRLGVEGPSLVDDWAAIERAPDQLASLLRLENPEAQRFRPAWIVWNALAWHTFDAPGGLVGPNAWTFVRVAVLVAGLTLLTALLLPPATDRRGALVHASLAGLPALLVLTVPKFARDVAWLGPQEPLLVGGLALGGSLLALAGKALTDEGSLPRGPVALLLVCGALFWLLGVYQKEASLSAVPVLAAVLVVARDRVRRARRSAPRRRAALALLAGIIVLPLLHVAVETARIAARGDLVYDAQVDAGEGIVRGLRVLYDWSHEALPPNARNVVVASLVVTAVAAVVRRRVDVLALSVLAAGGLAILVAAQSGVAVSRYYLPTYAMCAIALVVSLGRFPAIVGAAGALFLFFAFMPPGEPRAEVRRWTDEENGATAVVAAVAGLDEAGCTLAADALDLETSEAVPVLARLRRQAGVAPGRCAARAYFLLPPFAEGLSLQRACAPGRLRVVLASTRVNLHACERLAAGAVDDPELGAVAPVALVRARRFVVPGA